MMVEGRQRGARRYFIAGDISVPLETVDPDDMHEGKGLYGLHCHTSNSYYGSSYKRSDVDGD